MCKSSVFKIYPCMYGQGLRLHSKCDKYYFGNALALRAIGTDALVSHHENSIRTKKRKRQSGQYSHVETEACVWSEVWGAKVTVCLHLLYSTSAVSSPSCTPLSGAIPVFKWTYTLLGLVSAFNCGVWQQPKWAIKRDVSSGHDAKHAHKSVVTGCL